jgi:predicted dehydrogenase
MIAPHVLAERRIPPRQFERHYREKYAAPLRKALSFVGSEGVRATLRKARSKGVERRIEADQHIVVAAVELDGVALVGVTRDIGGALRFHPELLFEVVGGSESDASTLERVQLGGTAAGLAEAYLPVPSCPLAAALSDAVLQQNDWLRVHEGTGRQEWHAGAPSQGRDSASASVGGRPGEPAVAAAAARARGRGTRSGRSVWLIGYGGYAREQVLPHFHGDVVAAVDYKAALIDRHVRSPFPVRERLADVLDGVAAADRPLVIVSTYHSDHASAAETVLAANPEACVFLEKPPCVSVAEAERLEQLRGAGRWIDAGYNRRHAPFTHQLREQVQQMPRPLLLLAEVKELKLPPSHWYFWSNQGTRVTGNVCHWLDLFYHLAGDAPRELSVHGSDGCLSVTLTFPDGSVGTLLATDLGDDTAGVTERIGVRAGSSEIIIDDYRSLEMRSSGRTKRVRRQHRDKGHAAMYRDLRKRWLGGEPPSYPAADLLAVSALVERVAALVPGEAEPARPGISVQV